MRYYYAVPKTCDIYNNGYSATFGDGARNEIRNCIDSDKINELKEKGETENYKVCKADVHGEGWWGECDSGCDGDRKCGPPRTTDSEPGTPKPEDCRPGIVTRYFYVSFLYPKDIFTHQ